MVSPFFIMAIHIGNLIHKKLTDEGRTVTWLAIQLNCKRPQIYRIFDSSEIDTGVLRRLCRIFKYNFYFDLYKEIENT